MSLRTDMHHLRTQAQQLTMQRDSLLRLMMEVLVEHGGEACELIVSHTAANLLDLRRFVIDTLPTTDGRMAIRRRDLMLQATPGAVTPQPEPEAQSGLALVPSLSETIEEEERLNPLAVTIPAPCVCTHNKIRHIGSIGRCGEGTCDCEGYEAPVAVPAV